MVTTDFPKAITGSKRGAVVATSTHFQAARHALVLTKCERCSFRGLVDAFEPVKDNTVRFRLCPCCYDDYERSQLSASNFLLQIQARDLQRLEVLERAPVLRRGWFSIWLFTLVLALAPAAFVWFLSVPGTQRTGFLAMAVLAGLVLIFGMVQVMTTKESATTELWAGEDGLDA
ncbi:MAG: hypothetical protein V4671_26950 [Armatimonadota bacterium]